MSSRTASELVLVRHGEAVCNVLGIAGGDKGCTGLTRRGHWQAGRVADRLALEHRVRAIDVLYASPRRRVSETAEPIALRLGLTPVVEPDLRNPDHGSADGRPWPQVRAGVDGTVRHFPDRPPAPGAETWNQHLTRVTAALRSIVDRHPGQRVLVAGHRETIEAAYALMMAVRPNAAGPAASGRVSAARGSAGRADATVVGVDVEHTGLTRWCLRTDAQGFATWLLTQHNDATHLWCG